MGRYEIALKNVSPSKPSSTTLQFPATTSISKTMQFINYCIKNRKSLKVSGTPTHVLESALIRVSKLNRVPIIVASKDEAMMLSLAYSHQSIYSLDKLPHEGLWVICYNCDLPLNFKPYISVFNK